MPIDAATQPRQEDSPAGRPGNRNPVLHRESGWRKPAGMAANAAILASRWADGRTTPRQERCVGEADRYVVGVALRPVRMRIGRRANPAFEGVLSTGSIHVTAPGEPAEAEFLSPCDFVHFHVAVDDLRRAAARGIGAVPGTEADVPGLHDFIVRDELAAQLSRTLVEGPGCEDPLYAESVGRTIVMRLLARRQAAPRVGALPKWRLRRVEDYLAAHLADTIRLADLALAAGLSPMHFAAQFKVATGCRPHDFILQHRIEAAKAMLADTRLSLVEVALGTGFQTQSHFSTIFKRLVGETPGRWQRAHRHVNAAAVRPLRTPAW